MTRRTPATLGAALVLLLAVTGCGSAAERAASGTPSAPPTTPAPVPTDALVVEEIGHVGALYSVVVRNPDTDKGLRHASFVLVAQHADGRLVRYGERVPLGTPDTCCVIELLPPGGRYGLFFDIGKDAQDITEVSISVDPEEFRLLDPRELVPLTASAGLPTVVPGRAPGAAAQVTAVRTEVRTVVGSPRPLNVVVQPVLEDAQGRFVAVIGARVRCVPVRGGSLVVDLALPVRAPDGSRVREVLVHPAPTDTAAC